MWKKHSDFLTGGLFKYSIDGEDQEIDVIFLSLLCLCYVCPAYVYVNNYCNLSGHLIHCNGGPYAK